jgi:hypothetical protein
MPFVESPQDVREIYRPDAVVAEIPTEDVLDAGRFLLAAGYAMTAGAVQYSQPVPRGRAAPNLKPIY